MLMCCKNSTHVNTKHKQLWLFLQKNNQKVFVSESDYLSTYCKGDRTTFRERIPLLSLNDFYNNRFPLISLFYSARHKAECEAVLFLLWMGWEWEMSC